MDHINFRKGFVIALIILFVGASITPNILIQNVRADPEEDLVGYWNFDDGTAEDDSGNGNDGTKHGTTIVDGISGYGLEFDGIDDYVELPVGSSTGLEASHVTVEAWVYPYSLDERHLIFSYRPRRAGQDGRGYLLQISDYQTNNDKLVFAVGDGSPPYSSARSSNSVLENAWYHVVGTFDEQYIKVYINGELEATTTQSNTILYNDGSAYDPPYKNCIIGSFYSFLWRFLSSF
jgi:hypothetical protein